MKMASLFDGISGFPLAAKLVGIDTSWASEIDYNCIKVSNNHFPNMVHLGSVTEIKGTVAPVDIITFGSPCQNLSVAGNRQGLNGSESGLFLEAIRIIKEMREATNGQYPKYAIWENVPGAFTSNGGEDYRIVIESFIKVVDETISVPKPKKWEPAGMVKFNGGSLAWRTLDSQHWGVPQRRRRIFMSVCYTGDDSSSKIFLERKSLRGHLEKSCKEKQEVTRDPSESIRTTSFVIREGKEGGGKGYLGAEEIALPLDRTGARRVLIEKIYDDTAILFNAEGSVGATITKSNVGKHVNNQTPLVTIPDMSVRRLTVKECERLMGFPDDWTIGFVDSVRYKMLGNSVAIPCVKFIMDSMFGDTNE